MRLGEGKSNVDKAGIDALNRFRKVDSSHQQRIQNVRAGFKTGRFDVFEYTIEGRMLERWFLKTQST
jgi:hypothetical protein